MARAPGAISITSKSKAYLGRGSDEFKVEIFALAGVPVTGFCYFGIGFGSKPNNHWEY